MVVKRFEVWLVNLDPTIGSEIKKTRPALIISPDVTNKYLDTVVIAPLTSAIRPYPTRVVCEFQKKQGQIALDQLRAADKIRLVKKLGKMDEKVNRVVCDVLREYFRF
ncbi:MAG TPA: type II toxin-antitoxin system PemK/MazF family toxin [Chitinophagaceae bacterium]|nr:type II toxin-antitoxin system PemK/MazF family toxin [Chitinophagaceae bacterium]